MNTTQPPIAVCGIYSCETCEHLAAELCTGCQEGNMRLLAASGTPCAVYSCVQAHGLETCLECDEEVCALKRSVESICPLRSRYSKKRWWAGRMSRALESRKRPSHAAERCPLLPDRVVTRLRWYLTALDSFVVEGCESVSSWQIAGRVGVSAALVRKDLCRFGDFGTPSFGYKIDFLRDRIENILRVDRPRKVAWIGACAFRRGLAHVDRLAGHHCLTAAVFDVDPAEIGGEIAGCAVLPAERIRDELAGSGISAAVLAVGGAEAHEIAGVLVDVGVGAILNLSGELLVLPEQVKVTSLDLAGELIELCYYSDSPSPSRRGLG